MVIKILIILNIIFKKYNNSACRDIASKPQMILKIISLLLFYFITGMTNIQAWRD